MKNANKLKKNKKIMYALFGTIAVGVMGVFGMAINNTKLEKWIFRNGIKFNGGLEIVESTEDFITSFDYINGIKEYETEHTGKYKLEVWGAQGGTTQGYTGGYGGYAYGEIQLNKAENLYIAVGGAGVGATAQKQSLAGGYNGGGNVIASPTANHMTASRRRSNTYC